MKLEIHKLQCKKCLHTWVPRRSEVRLCPKCKTAYWDVKRNEKSIK